MINTNPTYDQIVSEYNLWVEYACGNTADRTEEEFDNSSYNELYEYLVFAFGEEISDAHENE